MIIVNMYGICLHIYYQFANTLQDTWPETRVQRGDIQVLNKYSFSQNSICTVISFLVKLKSACVGIKWKGNYKIWMALSRRWVCSWIFLFSNRYFLKSLLITLALCKNDQSWGGGCGGEDNKHCSDLLPAFLGAIRAWSPVLCS